MWLGIHLVRRGVITSEQLFSAVELQASRRPPLGQLAIKSGKMTMKQVFAVLSRQADWRGAFGKTAREMRLLTKRQLADLLLLQTESTPSLSELLIEMRLVTPEIVAHELARARDSKLDHCLPLSKDSQGIDSSLPAFVTNVQSEAFAHANQTSE